MNMKLNSRIKERIARTFGEYFTTNDITNVFKDFGVKTDVSLYAKWRITLDAFSRLSDPEKNIPLVIEDFCHPLNFDENEVQRQTFIDEINSILAYDDLKLITTEKNVKMVNADAPLSEHFVTSNTYKGDKTSTDYILEAVNFFKNEYDRVRIKGLSYDYSLGENATSEQFDQDYDEYEHKLNAIKRLYDAGLVTEYHVEERVENQGYYVWDYAICKLNENKLTGEEEKAQPVSADAVSDFKKQVIRHEHRHHFENNAQEKAIDLNLNYAAAGADVKSGFPHKIPDGTMWENITLLFTDDEHVKISVAGHVHDTGFADMGFVDGRSSKPTMLWHLLRLLAVKNGTLSSKDTEANDKYKHHKKRLTDALKLYFGLDNDPFKPYAKEKAYTLKMTIGYQQKSKSPVDIETVSSEVEAMFDQYTSG